MEKPTIRQAVTAQVIKYIPQLGVFIFVAIGICFAFYWRVQDLTRELKDCKKENVKTDSAVTALYERLLK